MLFLDPKEEEIHIIIKKKKKKNTAKYGILLFYVQLYFQIKIPGSARISCFWMLAQALI